VLITTNAHQITLASEMFAKRTVTTTKIAYPTKDAYEERVDRFVTVMHRAELVKFAKVASVKSVVATI